MTNSRTQRPRLILSASILSLLATAAISRGAAWDGSDSNDWNNPLNWDTGVVPVGAVDAYVGILGGGNPPFTATISSNIPTARDLQVARGGGPGILNHTAGTAATGAGNWFDIGTDGGTGTYNLADTASSGGTLTGFGLGSGSVTAERFYVGGVEFGGGGGTGVMNINTSGTINALFRFIVGEQGTGTVNMDNGTLNITNDWTVGFRTNGANNGNGTFNMSGGTVNRTGGWTTFGRDGASQGHFNMSGGTVNAVGQTIVGLNQSTGNTFTMSGGSFTAGELQIGRENGASGTLNISNGTMTTTGNAIIGLNNATGNFTMTGGIFNVGAEFWSGNQNNATGNTTISGGTLNVNSWLAIGRDNSNGTLTISGTGEVNQGITDAGAAFEMTNGTVGGTATVHLDGGSLSANRIVHGGPAVATTTFNFNGGVLKARLNEGNFIAGVDQANVRNGGAIIDSNGVNITVGQVLAHSVIGGDNAIDGGLTKQGAGILALSAANTYTGPTTVNTGTLALTGSIAASNFINVKSGATFDVSGVGGGFTLGATQTLAGDGTVAGGVGTSAGTKLSPGQSPGTLTLSGALDITNAITLSGSGALIFELGASSDQILLTTSALTIGSGVLAFNDFVFSDSGGLAAGTYTLFDTTTPILGTLDVANLTGAIGAFSGTIGFGDGGNDIVVTIVPEPGTAMALLGGFGLLGLRRRRK